VSRAEPQRLGRLRAEQQLRQLAHPVGGEPAADPLGRDERTLGASSIIWRSGLVVGREIELRDEPQPADEAQRVLGERARRDRAQHAVLEVLLPAERVDELAPSASGARSRSR
jgi:hypothetical protein